MASDVAFDKLKKSNVKNEMGMHGSNNNNTCSPSQAGSAAEKATAFEIFT